MLIIFFKYLANQGKKAVYSLKTTIRKLQYPKLFDTIVLPILSYSAEIWGFMEDSNLEAVELHYLKHILHVPLTASNIAVRGELGQLLIHLIWKERILRYWDRLCSNDIPMLLKEAVALAHQLGQTGKKCWRPIHTKLEWSAIQNLK